LISQLRCKDTTLF